MDVAFLPRALDAAFQAFPLATCIRAAALISTAASRAAPARSAKWFVIAFGVRDLYF